MENHFDLLFMFLLCRRVNKRFDNLSNGLDPYIFLYKRWNGRDLWKEKWTEGCLFPARVGIFPVVFNIIRVFFAVFDLKSV